MSQMGEVDILSGQAVTKQSHLGVMLVSSNSSTWTPEQDKDLKFTMNIADFQDVNDNIDTVLVFDNKQVPAQQMKNNPFFADTTFLVKVSQRNHGMVDGSEVVLAGTTAVTTGPAVTIDGTWTIFNSGIDHYYIDMSENGLELLNLGVDFGGPVAQATRQIQIDSLYPLVQRLVPKGTQARAFVRMTTGKQVPGFATGSYVRDVNVSPITMDEYTDMSRPYIVASDINELNKLGGLQSFELHVVIGTAVRNLSPLVDSTRVACNAKSNRIEYFSDISDELTAYGQKSSARYITRAIPLNSTSNGLRILFDANRPNDSDITVYYRGTNSDAINIAEQGWTEMTVVRKPGVTSDRTRYEEYEYEVDDLVSASQFSTFQVKLVMRARNSSRPPIIRAFRAIALGT